MRFRLATWRPTQLLLAWCVYWVALALAVAGPGMAILWRMSRSDAQGNASINVGNGGLRLIVEQAGVGVWTRDISLLALSLSLAVPPLVLWALWLRAQRTSPSRTSERSERVSGSSYPAP